jgi:hypothetical protein
VAVELIPKVLVVGLFAATQSGPPDRDRINRIWNELSSRQDYRQLSFAGDGAQLMGASADDALVIQPPLVQFRSTARTGFQNAADEAEVAMKTVARHLGYGQFFNLGIKHVYHATAPEKDARAFLLNQLVGGGSSDLSNLERGGGLWAGVKYGVDAPDGSVYTVVIEPLLADNQYIFIDLDAQLPGPADPDVIRERAAEAEDYADRTIRQYLEGATLG